MQSNVVPFPSSKTTGHKSVIKRYCDNVISLDHWREKTWVRRTNSGVYFTTGVLWTAGDFA